MCVDIDIDIDIEIDVDVDIDIDVEIDTQMHRYITLSYLPPFRMLKLMVAGNFVGDSDVFA